MAESKEFEFEGWFGGFSNYLFEQRSGTVITHAQVGDRYASDEKRINGIIADPENAKKIPPTSQDFADHYIKRGICQGLVLRRVRGLWLRQGMDEEERQYREAQVRLPTAYIKLGEETGFFNVPDHLSDLITWSAEDGDVFTEELRSGKWDIWTVQAVGSLAVMRAVRLGYGAEGERTATDIDPGSPFAAGILHIMEYHSYDMDTALERVV